MASIPKANRRTLALFFNRVMVIGTGCWIWRGSRTRKGYGMAFGTSAHRATYQWFVGPLVPGLSSGMVIDHLCRNRACVNPAHLDQVTIGTNNRRAIPFKRWCKNGLHRRGGNWQNGNGRNRTCAACHRIRQAKYMARLARRATKAA